MNIVIQQILTNKKFFIIALAIIILILIIFSVVHNSTQNQAQIPVKQISNFQIVEIGKTTDSQVKSLPNIKRTETISNSETLYALPSTYQSRDHTIITDNKIAIFEQAPTVTTELQHPTISTYLKQYGQPEKQVTGSKYYGPNEVYYIFASKGFTIIGNPGSDEVDEIQTYLPTTVDNYLQRYGADIETSSQGEQEPI